MRTLRRLAYVLLALLIVGWIVAWFAGRYIFFREVEPRLNALSAAGLSYEAEGHGLGGFPFSYSLQPKAGEVSDGPGAPFWDLSDATRVNVSLPGTAWGILTSSNVGARIHLNGEHKVLGALDVTFASGWVQPKLSEVGVQDGAPAWVFDGLDFQFRNMAIASNGAEIATLRNMTLTMTPLGEGRGYSYDLQVQDVSMPEGTFNQVPNTINGLKLRGELRPQVNSDLLLLAETVQQDPLSALSLFGETLGQILASGPGVYLEEGSFTWGDAQFDLTFDAPLNVRLAAANASLDLTGTIAGTNAMPLLQALIREPAARQSGLALPITALMTTAQSYGLDLQNGTPSSFSGTLIRAGRSGISLLPDGLTLNGRQVPGL